MAAFADSEREIIREQMETGRKAAEKRGVIFNGLGKEILKKAVLNCIEIGLSATATAKLPKVDPATALKG